MSFLELGISGESPDNMAPQADAGDDEAALIERAKTAPEAFGRLFESHYQRILNYIYRSTLNLAIAEELTSNTFFKAFRAIGGYRHRISFSAWLYSIATNEIRMHWRSESRKRKTATARVDAHADGRIYFDSPTIEAGDSLGEKMEQCARLHEMLGRLPERYRSVIVLRYFEELSYEVIAQVLGKRLGTVKSLIHRAIRRLKGIMEQDATFRISRHSQ
ncbi:MAG: RNA polymerase sigma factor [Thermoguttaceae bacterium]